MDEKLKLSVGMDRYENNVMMNSSAMKIEMTFWNTGLRSVRNVTNKQNLEKLSSVILLCLVSCGNYRSYYFTEAV